MGRGIQVVTETVSKLLVDETTVALEARETLCASVHRARIRISSSAPFSLCPESERDDRVSRISEPRQV
jgi:hypothetical protein